MIRNVRVGIAAIGSSKWLGGLTIIDLLVTAVRSLPRNEQPQLLLVASDQTVTDWPLYQPFAHFFDNVLFCGLDPASTEQVLPPFIPVRAEELFNYIDFYFPVNSDVLPGVCSTSWIPDFQHRFLPGLFSEQEQHLRDAAFARIASQARLLVLNSLEVEDHFRCFYPESQTKTRVLRYSVAPSDHWLAGDPHEVQAKYNLPDKFVLCSNQFWQHKNHAVLFRAIALLKQAGINIELVCTGLTQDYRNPDYFYQLWEFATMLGINEQIHILGMIPRLEQIQLLRRCAFAVQPSLFEGLSLIVCECRALGKPILLSDLAVHVEHEYGTLFKRTDPCDLAIKLAKSWLASQPGPDLALESKAKQQAAASVHRFARDFCSLVLEARSLYTLDRFRKGDANL